MGESAKKETAAGSLPECYFCRRLAQPLAEVKQLMRWV